METLKIVNKNLAGEPEHAVLQNVHTNAIYEFSQIAGETITDGDLSNPTIQRILSNGHTVQATITNGSITLNF